MVIMAAHFWRANKKWREYGKVKGEDNIKLLKRGKGRTEIIKVVGGIYKEEGDKKREMRKM